MKYSRTRIFSDIQSRPRSYSGRYTSGVYYDPWPGKFWSPEPRGTVWREISDVVSKQKRGTHPVNPCLDTYVRLIPRTRAMRDMGRASRSDQIYNMETAVAFHPALIAGYSYSQSPFDSGQLAYKAFDTFSTQVPEEISIANFALEWRESVAMIPGLIEHFATAWKRLPRSVKQDGTVGDLMAAGAGQADGKELASAHLGFQFGVLPLIGDLQKIAGLLGSVQARLDHLRSINGTSKRLQYLPGGAGSPANFSNGVPVIRPRIDIPNGGDAQVFQDTLILEYMHAGFTATAYVDVELEGLDGLEGYLRTLYGSLGLNNPLGAIWNALPLSFLVDWVVDVSGLLARHSVKPFNGLYRVRDLTHAYKCESRWAIERKWYQPVTRTPQYEAMGRMIETTYQRETGLPESQIGNLLNFPLTPGQATLLLALMRQFT